MWCWVVWHMCMCNILNRMSDLCHFSVCDYMCYRRHCKHRLKKKGLLWHYAIALCLWVDTTPIYVCICLHTYRAHVYNKRSNDIFFPISLFPYSSALIPNENKHRQSLFELSKVTTPKRNSHTFFWELQRQWVHTSFSGGQATYHFKKNNMGVMRLSKA